MTSISTGKSVAAAAALLCKDAKAKTSSNTFWWPDDAVRGGHACRAHRLGQERPVTVIRLVARGRSNQQIAGDLVVALDTVKKHVTHVLGKLGAANRTEAVARARQLGLLP